MDMFLWEDGYYILLLNMMRQFDNSIHPQIEGEEDEQVNQQKLRTRINTL